MDNCIIDMFLNFDPACRRQALPNSWQAKRQSRLPSPDLFRPSIDGPFSKGEGKRISPFLRTLLSARLKIR